MISRIIDVKGEFFGFRFSAMILGLGVTALIFFVSFFVSRQKMKSPAGSRRLQCEKQNLKSNHKY